MALPKFVQGFADGGLVKDVDLTPIIPKQVAVTAQPQTAMPGFATGEGAADAYAVGSQVASNAVNPVSAFTQAPPVVARTAPALAAFTGEAAPSPLPYTLGIDDSSQAAIGAVAAAGQRFQAPAGAGPLKPLGNPAAPRLYNPFMPGAETGGGRPATAQEMGLTPQQYQSAALASAGIGAAAARPVFNVPAGNNVALVTNPVDGDTAPMIPAGSRAVFAGDGGSTHVGSPIMSIVRPNIGAGPNGEPTRTVQYDTTNDGTGGNAPVAGGNAASAGGGALPAGAMRIKAYQLPQLMQVAQIKHMMEQDTKNQVARQNIADSTSNYNTVKQAFDAGKATKAEKDAAFENLQKRRDVYTMGTGAGLLGQYVPPTQYLGGMGE